jgi:ABC-type nitrate/sulfonate/bicarbonate transport system permease component
MMRAALQRYTRRQASERRHGLRHAAISGLLFLLLLAGLEVLLALLQMPAYILPPPSAVLAELLAADNRLAGHMATTALAGVGGFLLGSLAGFGLATLFVHLPTVERALYPWVIASQTMPLVVLAPLLVLWFGNGLPPRIVMAALFSFFPVLVSAARGLRAAPPEAMALLQACNAGGWQRFRMLRLPAALPYLFAGLKVGATLAVIGAIVAEFAGANRGLGFVITVSSYHLETARTFAAISLAALLGLSLHLILGGLEQRLAFWNREA